jgi:hypothetical protein
MSNLTVRCIRGAFLYLALGVAMGVAFAFNRALGAVWRPLHAELNLWGWTTLLIYGMAYHMLPRFAGLPVRWPQVAEHQSWLALIGVGIATAGWLSLLNDFPFGGALLAAGGVLQFLAALLFAGLLGDVLLRKP